MAVDHAPRAIAVAQTNVEAAGVEVELLEADVLALPSNLQEAFDVVWEQTCFCALHPGQRGAYVEAMALVLRPGGVLHALLWHHGHDGGPPFDVSPEDAHAAFGGPFALEHLEPVPSHPRRSHEFLGRWRRLP